MATTLSHKAVLMAGLALAGCDVNIHGGKASVGMLSSRAAEEWTHHYPLADGGITEVVNVNGAVNVTTGTAGVVEVHALITANALTDAGARDLLSKGRVQEITEPQRIHIETMQPRGIRGSYAVNYDVRIPPGARADISQTNGALNVHELVGSLKALAVNGRLEIQNAGGGIDAEAVNGSMRVSLTTVTAPVRLEMTNGPMVVELASAARANLSARVVNGRLAVTGLPIEGVASGRNQNLDSALNGGGPAVSLRVTNGRISIEGK